MRPSPREKGPKMLLVLLRFSWRHPDRAGVRKGGRPNICEAACCFHFTYLLLMFLKYLYGLLIFWRWREGRCLRGVADRSGDAVAKRTGENLACGPVFGASLCLLSRSTLPLSVHHRLGVSCRDACGTTERGQGTLSAGSRTEGGFLGSGESRDSPRRM